MIKTTENTEKSEKHYNDTLTGMIIGCAIEVHSILGPGLLESTYRKCLEKELSLKDISYASEHSIPVDYKGIHLDCGYRIDILVTEPHENKRKIILELKSVKSINDTHRAQILTYMKLAKAKTGLLINFNVKRLKEGIERFVL